MKKKRLLFSLVLVFFLSNVMSQDRLKIQIGVTDSYPPFSMLDPDGNLIGFDIDIAHALCNAMQAKCTFSIINFEDLIPTLVEGKINAIIASLTITQKRKKKIAFTDKYYYTPVGWVAKKGSFSKINNIVLSGKNIGVLANSVFEDYLNQNYTRNSIIIKYKEQDKLYLALKTGKIDIFIADVLQVNHFFLSGDNGNNYEFVGEFLSDKEFFGEGIGIATRKKDYILLETLNDAIKQIRSNGEYTAIRKKYFAYDIYGN